MHIAAIVVTYNRKDVLLRCVESLLHQQGLPSTETPDILLIDNASTDGTEEAIKPLLCGDRVRYHNTGANLGGAGGFQYGMRLAVEAGYTHLWIMDDDCIPEPNALAALLEGDRQLKGDYGFLSSLAYWRDGSPCSMNIQKTGLKTKLEHPEKPLEPVIMATFVSAFFPACRVRELGLPIKEFFIWSDDLEYTRRLSRRYPCYAVTGSRVLHDMCKNDKVNIATDTGDRLPRYRYLYRNEVYVYRREGLRGWLYLLPRIAFHILRVLGSHASKKGVRIGIILRSFAAGFTFRPAVEYPALQQE